MHVLAQLEVVQSACPAHGRMAIIGDAASAQERGNYPAAAVRLSCNNVLEQT